jgi:hypothetical protein
MQMVAPVIDQKFHKCFSIVYSSEMVTVHLLIR